MAPCDHNAEACAPGPPRHGDMAIRRQLGYASVALVLCLALASCGGEATLLGPNASGSPLAPPRATSPATPRPPGSATPSTPMVGPIVWTTAVDPRSSAPSDTVTTYPPDAPRLIAAAPMHGLPSGATLTASWSYNDTSLDAFGTALTVTSGEQTWVSFYIARSDDSLWPAGVYAITISLAGREVARSTVEVVASD